MAFEVPFTAHAFSESAFAPPTFAFLPAQIIPASPASAASAASAASPASPRSPIITASVASVDPTTIVVPLEPPAQLRLVGGEPSMNDDLTIGDDEADDEGNEADDDGLATTLPPALAPIWLAAGTPPSVPASPRQRRRAQAQPMRLHASPPVCCYRYEQGRPAAELADGRWQGSAAYLHYFLPENWSPSYKFTVFEDSYVLSFARAAGDPPWPPTAYHLARPLHGARERPEFELVWPIELDRSLLETIEASCDRVVPGAKRKPGGLPQPLSLHSVHLKLQRLEM